MPRPTTKESLLTLSETNLEKLFSFIDSIPEELRNNRFELNERDKTIADVLCHLHEWHLMMENWYATGMSGKKPIIPGEGYTWQTLPALNRKIHEKYLGTDWKKAVSLLKQSHKKIMKLIEKHSNEELFTKQYYPWTGTTSLGSYFISSTSSHYDWGLKTLKVIKKEIA
ncbi:ClbS/DfsB family four-helix bundle protein [Brucepastera parasyntrophica]|uniref:ClbS/DfsB family four-helix bundle protein n=1 Tax=Brucepastera parasyntrophica TaxID=2880008 RepID=UPI00210BA8B5|nr:ClbS/DfsB family four-helix bundle protein [Brucepastera parasyntrophica]ULQ60632.1 ClbS/DfsB family four-helix bundle protein [Brucepastera parasyntrophica]